MQNELENTTFSAEVGEDDRRGSTRYPARAKAMIYRDSDAMRTGSPASTNDISVSGLGLLMKESPPDLDEVIKIRLTNEIQRFDREVRGYVRHVTKTDDDVYRIGVELLTRLTPLEVSLLRLSCTAGLGDNESSWV